MKLLLTSIAFLFVGMPLTLAQTQTETQTGVAEIFVIAPD